MSRRKRKRRSSSKLQRRLRTAVVLLVLFSAYQYQETGSISWPGALYERARSTIGDYAAHDNAGWRKAADTLEGIGQTREGVSPAKFDLEGRVVRVSDGDTLSLLDDTNRQHKIRLFGIDTPEYDQPHGKAAHKALANLVDNRHVGVVRVETDSYGRTVGLVYQGQTNINLAMLSSGDAWWYRYYAPHERQMEQAEAQAREAQAGLWTHTNPVPPWDWRRGKR